MSCGVDHRCGSDLVWLWLWLWGRLAATTLIRSLAWELSCAADEALKSKTKTKSKPKPKPKTKKRERKKEKIFKYIW